MVDTDMIANKQSEAIVHFTDQQAADNRTMPSDIESTRLSSMKSDAEFSSFFERPILIHEYSWNVGTTFDFEFDPWTDWFSNKRVSNRCNNFKNIACKLHLKFVVNGNGFYWGDVLVSYCPYASEDDFYYRDPNDVIPASQRMHLNLDPSISKGGTLSLPFFCETDMVNIQVSELDKLGRIWMKDLAPLRHPSTTNPLQIQVFAWATDVKLSSPTATNADELQEQSGEIDEFSSDGPVSKPAAIIEKLAGKLESVPALKPYAMASKMAAGVVKTVAGAFGYSRPRSIEGVQSYRLMQTGDLSTTDAVDTSVGLGITAKREITLDPRTTGLTNDDELSLKYLCGIESYLTSKDWAISKLAGDTLMSFPVTPTLPIVGPRSAPLNTGDAIYTAPVGWIAPNFQYWRGTLRYRFRVISSNFHKGRLALRWDPGVKTPTLPEFNIVRTHIVDIGETKDFYVDVGWGQDYAALFVGGVPQSNLIFTSSPSNVNARTQNGSLTLSVVTPLVGPPDSTEPVAIQMWMSSPDMEFFDPTNRYISDFSHYPVPPPARRKEPSQFQNLKDILSMDLTEQSGDMHADNDTAGIQPTKLEMLGSPIDKSSATFMSGEAFSSLRPLLKRYTFRNSFYVNTTATDDSIAAVTVLGDNMEPIFRRFESSAPNQNLEARGNVVATTLYRWILPAFAGYRGSRRGKYIPLANKGDLGLSTILMRADISQLYATQVLGGTATDSETLSDFFDVIDITGAGTIVSTPNMSGVVEYEMPWYERLRFTTRHLSTDVNRVWNGVLTNFWTTGNKSTVGKRIPVAHYEAAGEDWNVFYFKGVPPCFLCEFPNPIPPTPANEVTDDLYNIKAREGLGRPLQLNSH